MKENFFMNSSDGKNDLHGMIFLPEGEPKAVVQIIHGMGQYIGKYEPFANFLTSKGFAVYGIDVVGHGGSAATQEDLGHFADKGGKGILLTDQHSLLMKIKQDYPGKKVFLIGHSMGSFILRRFLAVWGKEIDGAVIVGTGNVPQWECRVGKFAAFIARSIKGPRYRSKTVSWLATGYYAEEFYSRKKKGSWLTRDKKCADAYRNDPRCNYMLTVSACHTIISLMEDCATKKNNKRIPTTLPILFVSGMDDPVGAYSEGVLQVYNQFVSLGFKDIDVMLYNKNRHNILDDLDKETVFADIEDFISQRV